MADSVDIEVRDLCKSYGRNAVLESVSFRVEAGGTLALLGPSGCGKSTTLSIVAGITTADSGRVFFGGVDMTDVAVHRRGVGVVFQSYALFPHMTVQRNIEFGPRVQRRPKDECARLAAESMGMTHLSEFSDRLPGQLSGGQRQRVAVARALASRPQVLLLDEPLSSLDASLREEMQFEIRDLQAETGISMIFVTHDQQEAMAVADQIGVLVKGSMRQVGSPAELYDRPRDLEVARFLGKVNLLPARASAVTGMVAELAGPGGQRWRGPVADSQRSGLTDAQAVVMVRPEALRIAARVSETENSVYGVVKRATFLGREANVLVDAGFSDLEVRSSTTDATNLRPGMNVTLAWSCERCVVFADEKMQLSSEGGEIPDESLDATLKAT